LVFGHRYLVDDREMAAADNLQRMRLERCVKELEGLKTRMMRNEIGLEVPPSKQGKVKLEVSDLGGRGRAVRLFDPASKWLLLEIERHIHGGATTVLMQFWLYSARQRRITLIHEHQETVVGRGDWTRDPSLPPTTIYRDEFFDMIQREFGHPWVDSFRKLFQFQEIKLATLFPEVTDRCREIIGIELSWAQDSKEKPTRKISIPKTDEVIVDFQAGIRLVHAIPLEEQ
jgi:hypothetical protein